MIDTVTLTAGAAFSLGFTFGAGACNIACLPYLGPIFFAGESGIKKAWPKVTIFSIGRLTGYALVGLLAGSLGDLLEQYLAETGLRWLLGLATLSVAISLAFSSRKKHKSCLSGYKSKSKFALPGGLFFMGLGMAFNPCAPLSTLLVAAATTGSAITGLSLGLAFGVGAVVLPTLIFTFGVAHFAAELRANLGRWQTHIEYISAAMMLLMGIGTFMGWITP